MRTVKITDLITLSFERTKLILFQPFELKKWLKLLFIAFMAGALSGGGCQGGSGTSEKKAEATIVNEQTNAQVPASLSDQETAPSKVKNELNNTIIWIGKSVGEFAKSHPVLWVVLIIGSIVLFAVFLLLMTWLSSRFRFVFLNSVIHNSTDIRVPFKEYRKEGNSLYQVSLVVTLSFIILLAVSAVWMFLSMDGSGKINLSNPMTMAKLIVVAVVFFSAIVLGVIWGFFLDQFVVPIMMLEKQTYLPAWEKFCRIYINQRGEFWIYLIVMFGLGIVSSILGGIITVIVFILGAFLVGILYGIGYLMFAVLLKAKILFIGFAIGAGIPLAFVCGVVLFSIFLPIAVFFRVFSLYFLSSLNEGYAPLPMNE